jgi:predicted porin
MKKSLFALAAMTAVAGAAQAQSSVTVYGILDMGYAGSNSRLVDKAGNVVKTTNSAFNQSQEQTSRLGFKGTEDLGGGASAFFTVELGLTPQVSGLSGSGTVKDTFQNTDQNSGSAVDNRQSFVGLKKNGLGQFAFGRQYTPIFNAGAATDASQYANVVGNVIYQGSAVGTAADSGLGAASLNGAFTNRANSSITAKSDNFGGFTVSGMYAMSNQNQTFNPYNTPGTANNNTSAGGNTNWNGWGLGADFTWQKLYATVAYQSFTTVYSENNVYTANNINLGGGATAGQPVAAGTLFGITNLKDNYAYKYDDSKGYFITVTKGDLLDDIISNRVTDIQDIYDEYKTTNKIDDKTKKLIQDFLEKMENKETPFYDNETKYDNFKTYKTDTIKILLYNNQEKITKDIATMIDKKGEPVV